MGFGCLGFPVLVQGWGQLKERARPGGSTREMCSSSVLEEDCPGQCQGWLDELDVPLHLCALSNLPVYTSFYLFCYFFWKGIISISCVKKQRNKI